MLKEFTRVAWASESAQAVWEPRVQAIQQAWADVELRSVAERLRPAALVFGVPHPKYRLAGYEVAPNRYAVAPGDDALRLADAYKNQDDEVIGALLGFPPCCRAFFDRVWNVEKKRDTTLSMADTGFSQWRSEDQHGIDGRTVVTANGFREANILGRWLGVRFVPHLPCSWHCGATAEHGLELLDLWPVREAEWAREILSWRVKYSALHGIAIVTFPVVKIVTDTDYTASERIIERPGGAPAEAPRGLVFPFTQRPAKVAAPVISITSLRDPRAWTDNGFTSKAAMDAAHDMVIRAIAERLGHGPHGQAEIIDFGSGNGELLRKIQSRWKAEVLGVEADADRASRSKVTVKIARIEDLPERLTRTYGIGLISARRLEEMDMATEERFLTWARTFIGDLLIYSYDEPQFTRWDRQQPWLEQAAA